MTPAEFKAAFPPFGDIGDVVVQRHIDVADGLSPSSGWSSNHVWGIGHLVAHLIAVEKRDMAAGVVAKPYDVVSASHPGGSVTRATAGVEAEIEDPIKSTHWGKMFRMLEKQYVTGIPLVLSSTSRGFSSRGVSSARNPSGWDNPLRIGPGNGFVGD